MKILYGGNCFLYCLVLDELGGGLIFCVLGKYCDCYRG